MGLLKLLRSLEGGTRVQQIIIGYFVAPISPSIFMAHAGKVSTHFKDISL
jgi:hypothetical protein